MGNYFSYFLAVSASMMKPEFSLAASFSKCSRGRNSNAISVFPVHRNTAIQASHRWKIWRSQRRWLRTSDFPRSSLILDGNLHWRLRETSVTRKCCPTNLPVRTAFTMLLFPCRRDDLWIWCMKTTSGSRSEPKEDEMPPSPRQENR